MHYVEVSITVSVLMWQGTGQLSNYQNPCSFHIVKTCQRNSYLAADVFVSA